MPSTDVKLLAAIEYLEKQIASLTLKHGKDGKDGKNGKDGRNGADGRNGRDGRDGVDGRDGERGADGISVVGANVDFDGRLVLELSNGDELDAGVVVPELDAEKNVYVMQGGGGSAGVKYTAVTTTTYTVQESDLIEGINIYGVDSGGNTTVFLPANVDPKKIIVVSNEMDTFTVTTQVL